ncbi:hypothetical protein L596_007908 [Steinernema carpocapsae]|uniref:Uncharacterized protein n=1 Tax=Steinernema carpocapsae TaxID=34508 RepID=A0A4U5PBD6_STECR|nr:hypothetical protein L596_007908 [Steinernema carpocapsae]
MLRAHFSANSFVFRCFLFREASDGLRVFSQKWNCLSSLRVSGCVYCLEWKTWLDNLLCIVRLLIIPTFYTT